MKFTIRTITVIALLPIITIGFIFAHVYAGFSIGCDWAAGFMGWAEE